MAKDNLKLKIDIEGDNKGFQKALGHTEKEIDSFASKIGNRLGFGSVLDVLQSAALLKMSGFKGPKLKGFTTQVGGGGAYQNLRQGFAAYRLGREENSLRKRVLKAEQKAGQLPFYSNNFRHGDQLKLMGGQMMANGIRMMTPVVMSALTTGAGLAAMGAAVAKLMSANQQKLDKKAVAFSAPVLRHEAMLELSQLRGQMARANDPGFIAQQKELARATMQSNLAGTSQSGRDVFTDAEIVAKKVYSFLLNAVSGNATMNDIAFFMGGVY